jgi:hypothetical protein
MYPNPNNQFYIQDLQNMRERIDKQLAQMQQMQNPQYQQTPQINQTFQLSSNQNNSGIKYVNSIDDVKKELVFTDTLFVNKDYTQLWLKNATGEVKTYALSEIIELDPQQLRIKELEAKIDMLVKERETEDAKHSTEYVDRTTSNEKPTKSNSTKTSDTK